MTMSPDPTSAASSGTTAIGGKRRETCLAAMAYLLERSGDDQHAGAIAGRLLDCAALCGLQQELLLRTSPLAAEASCLCQAACERCAEECERMPGDQQLRAHVMLLASLGEDGRAHLPAA